MKMMHSQRDRVKRSMQYFESDCKYDVMYWSENKKIAASILFPWVAAAKTLGQLDHLGAC